MLILRRNWFNARNTFCFCKLKKLCFECWIPLLDDVTDKQVSEPEDKTDRHVEEIHESEMDKNVKDRDKQETDKDCNENERDVNTVEKENSDNREERDENNDEQDGQDSLKMNEEDKSEMYEGHDEMKVQKPKTIKKKIDKTQVKWKI